MALLATSCASVMLSAVASSPSRAQVVLPPTIPAGPPWNSQDVFEPLWFPHSWYQEGRVGRAPEDLPVKIRQHPGYESIGVRMGAWMFEPSLSVGGRYSSNVFATNRDPRSDLTLVVQPALRMQSLWDRHQLSVVASLRSNRYLENSELSYTDARMKARGRIDVRHDMTILTDFEAGWLHEPVGSLTSPAGAAEATPYGLLSGDVTYRQQFNRLTASVGGRFASYSFGSVQALNGTTIDQSSRDGTIYVVHGRVDHALSPKLSVFAAAEGNQRDLRGTATQSLSSHGYRVLTGVTAELTHLITGEVGVGFASQQFDAQTIGDVTGPAYRAMLMWSPTRMIDVWLKTEQIVTQTGDTVASGIRANAVAVGVDYEFRRNIVLSLAGILENDKFFGQPRVDDVYAVSTEIKYLVNRHASAGLRHRYVTRNSNIPVYTYDKHEVGINVTAKF